MMLMMLAPFASIISMIGGPFLQSERGEGLAGMAESTRTCAQPATRAACVARFWAQPLNNKRMEQHT